MVKKKKTNISTKVQLYVATGTVLLLIAFGMVVGWLDASVESPLRSHKDTVALTDVTLKGKPACIGHTGDGPQTMECLMGLKTANGAVYAIKGATVPDNSDDLEFTGTLTPASSGEVYKIDGTLTVTK